MDRAQDSLAWVENDKLFLRLVLSRDTGTFSRLSRRAKLWYKRNASQTVRSTRYQSSTLRVIVNPRVAIFSNHFLHFP